MIPVLAHDLNSYLRPSRMSPGSQCPAVSLKSVTQVESAVQSVRERQFHPVSPTHSTHLASQAVFHLTLAVPRSQSDAVQSLLEEFKFMFLKRRICIDIK